MISVDWGTKVITIPQADLTPLGGVFYELDLNEFRLALKNLEDDEAGIPYPITHNHNTEVSVGGITLARVIEIINGYTVTFEDGQYAVDLVGANSNLSDVMNVNQVSCRSHNSAGMVVVSGGEGGGPTAEQIAAAVWNPNRTEARAAGLDEITAARLAQLDADGLEAGLTLLLERLTDTRATSLDAITEARLAQLDPAGLATGIATLTDRLTSNRAAALDAVSEARLAQLDTEELPAAIASLLDRLTSERAGKLDNLDTAVSTRAAPGAAMALTSGERDATADALLDRDMAAGTDTGSAQKRTVRQALRALRNRVFRDLINGLIRVYKENDATVSWTASVSSDQSAPPMTGWNPED